MGARRTSSAPASMHATCVVLGGRGVLIRGRSGAGKSDLALRLIADGARLVADDQVVVRARAGKVTARAPALLRGLIEVRGVGIVPVPTVGSAVVSLVVDLVPGRAVPRLPEPTFARIAGVAVRSAMLAPFEASAVAKVRLALRFGAGSTGPARRVRRVSQRTSSS